MGAHSDDGELVGIASSELLDAGGFPAADSSMRRPEPQHEGPIRRGEAGQVHGGAGVDVHQFDGGEIRFWGRRRALRRRFGCGGLSGRRFGWGRCLGGSSLGAIVSAAARGDHQGQRGKQCDDIGPRLHWSLHVRHFQGWPQFPESSCGTGWPADRLPGRTG